MCRDLNRLGQYGLDPLFDRLAESRPQKRGFSENHHLPAAQGRTGQLSQQREVAVLEQNTAVAGTAVSTGARPTCVRTRFMITKLADLVTLLLVTGSTIFGRMRRAERDFSPGDACTREKDHADVAACEGSSA
jgi:hypothetical protein